MKYFNLGFRDTRSLSHSFGQYVAPEVIEKHLSSKSKRSTLLIIGLIVLASFLAILWFVWTQNSAPDQNAHGLPPVDPLTRLQNNPMMLAAGGVIVFLIGIAILLALSAKLVHFLHGLTNPLYWEISCWLLITIGILIRPVVINKEFSDGLTGTFIAAAIALAVFPAIMRLFNRVKPDPGLIHIALPFSLGFFLDVAQVLTVSYMPDMSWLQ